MTAMTLNSIEMIHEVRKRACGCEGMDGLRGSDKLS